jgi:hypothetical protein
MEKQFTYTPKWLYTVYCHLQTAEGEISDYIKKAQYKNNLLKLNCFLKQLI